jgi:lysophospholipase L1-like esterase
MGSRARPLRILLAILALAALAEGTARLAFAIRGVRVEAVRRNTWNPLRGDNFYEAHPYLPYVLRANLAFPGLHTNSLGRRGHEPRPGAFRILCVGGSTTFGTAEEDEIWPAVLERDLERLHPGREIDVQNAGVPAYTTGENLLDLALRGLDLDPDVVVFLVGLNDLTVSNAPAFRSDYSHARRSLPHDPNLLDRAPLFFERSAAFLALRYALYGGSRHSAVGLHGLASLRPPVDETYRGLPTFERNLRSLVALARSAGASPVLVTQPFLPREPGWTRAMEETLVSVRGIAGEEGIPLADAAARVREPGLFVEGDPFHTEAAGDRLLAQCVLEAVLATGRLEEAKSAESLPR